MASTPSCSGTTNGRGFLPGAKEKLLAMLSSTSSGEEEDCTSSSPQEELWSGVLGVVLESAYEQQEWGLATALVGAGAEVGALDLRAALEGDQDELAAALLENGASISAHNTAGETPLHVAARQGNGAMAELLVHKGAHIDAEVVGWTPLFLAAARGSVEVVQVLMRAGADSRSIEGMSPLVLAADNGHVDALKTMIGLGGDVNAADQDGWTALHSAKGKAMVDMLIEAGANIEARDSEDDTALNYLAQYHAIAPMRALVGHGADVNTQNENGDAPLHFAARAGGDQDAAELVDFLLRSGADETVVNRNNDAAADVVGRREHEDDTEENMARVRKLLANASIDRVWRRRGLLLLCVARYRRDQPPSTESTSGDNPGIAVQEYNSSSELVGSSSGIVEERDCGEWGPFAARVVELVQGKEGIFRTIVGFM